MSPWPEPEVHFNQHQGGRLLTNLYLQSIYVMHQDISGMILFGIMTKDDREKGRIAPLTSVSQSETWTKERKYVL